MSQVKTGLDQHSTTPMNELVDAELRVSTDTGSTAFIIGLPRSGTTLLSFLLAGVDRSLSLSEPFLAHAIYSPLRLRWFFSRLQKKANLQRLSAPKCADYTGFLDYLSEIARINKLKHLIIKETFRAGREWDNLAMLNHMASSKDPIIAIMRHPYDIAYSSIRFTRWWRGIVGRALRIAAPGLPLFSDDREVVQYTAENWLSFAKWCQCHEPCAIRYEDLVNDPEIWIRKVCDYAKLPFYKNILDTRHPRNPFGGIGDPGVMQKTPKPISTQSIGRKERLLPEYQEIIASICGDAVAEWDYKL